MNFNFLFQVTGSCLLLLCMYMFVVRQYTCTHRYLDFVIISWWYLRFWIYVVFGHGRKLSSLQLFSASLHYSHLTAKTSTSLCRSKTHSSSQALVTCLMLRLTHTTTEHYDIFVPEYNLLHGAWMRYQYINNRRWVMFLASKTEDNHVLSLKVPYGLGL